jgi:hypothetical protein
VSTTHILRAIIESKHSGWRSSKVGKMYTRVREIGFCNKAVLIMTGGKRCIYRTALLDGEMITVEQDIRTHCLGGGTPKFTHITLVEAHEPKWTVPIQGTKTQPQIIVVIGGSITLKNAKGEPRTVRQDEFAVIPRITLKVPQKDHKFTIEVSPKGATWLELRGTEEAGSRICLEGIVCTRTVCTYSHVDRDLAEGGLADGGRDAMGLQQY